MEEQQISMSFKIADIARLGMSMAPEYQPNPMHRDFDFDIQLEGSLDQHQKTVGIVVTIDVRPKDQPQKVGKYVSGVTYVIENFEDVFETKTTTFFVMNRVFNEILISVALSTTRGMMAEAFRGTALHYAILPVLDPKTFVADNPSESTKL